jgi:DNA polymerase III sliding clamp (beta) subunit (PCNA family)
MVDIKRSLKLVRGAVNERSLVTVLTHFCIHEGRIYGSNGRVSVDAPFPVLRDAPTIVPAVPFYSAVDKCEGDPIIEINDEFLTLKSKVRTMRRIRLPLSQDPYSIPVTEGDRYEIPDKYRRAMTVVREFISKDASRPWAMGLLHSDNHLYATNNVILARTPLDWPPEYPVFGLPSFAVDEICRIASYVDLKYLWMSENMAMYEFEDDVWVRSVLYEAQWPDVANMIPDCSNLPLIPKDFKDVTRDLIPFNEDSKFPVVKYNGKVISTLEGNMVAQDELEVELSEASFHSVPLLMILNQATRLDLTPYPKPCPWSGTDIEGVIVGVRT